MIDYYACLIKVLKMFTEYRIYAEFLAHCPAHSRHSVNGSSW